MAKVTITFYNEEMAEHFFNDSGVQGLFNEFNPKQNGDSIILEFDEPINENLIEELRKMLDNYLKKILEYALGKANAINSSEHIRVDRIKNSNLIQIRIN